jgi:hypothetical protein
MRVTNPAGKTQKVRAEHNPSEPGSFATPVQVDLPGVYRVAADVRRGGVPLGSAEAAMLVGGADPEMTDPRLNTQVLERVALESGGRVVTAHDVEGLVDTLRRRVPAARLAVIQDVWNTGWSFAALVLLLGAEWILRRRWGLR